MRTRAEDEKTYLSGYLRFAIASGPAEDEESKKTAGAP